jgi:fructokinase
VVIDPVGNASYVINKQVAYDAITLTDELLAAAKGCSVLCFGTLSQREEASRRTLYSLLDAASSATKILDINLRRGCYTEKTVRESLEATHILKLNGDEAVELSKMLWGRALPFREFASNAVSRYHLRSCLVTLAADGIYGLGADGTETVLPGHSVQVVDTIGSGDAFTAGFAYQLLQGSPLPECCDYGNRLGALTATTTGAMTPISPAQIASFPPDGRRVAVGS